MLLCAAAVSASASHLQDALDLEKKGKLKEASEQVRAATVELRASGDLAGLAKALSVSSRIAVSLGEYRFAMETATEGIGVRIRLKDQVALSEDYNTRGLAHVYLGDYDAALADYRKALEIDRGHHDFEAQIARLNNIASVYYYRGQYQDALRAYQQSMETIDAAGPQTWTERRRQLAIANLAALYQRLGQEQTALEYYRQLTATPQALPRAEYAQLLLNEGVLYRRMGDPVKALDRYRLAQAVFAAEHHRDGEIGALRNIGIARAIDLGDLEGARQAFTAGLDLARASGDTRGIVQAALYRAEVYRRLGRPSESRADLEVALAGAEKAGLPEELWKSEYGMGRLAEASGQTSDAAALYRKAIAGIESVRAGLRRTNLRSEFLADKREVYDSMISLALHEPDPPLDEIFSLMERSRARALEERAQTSSPKEASLAEVQSALPRGTALLEFWVGDGEMAALWMTRSGAGVLRRAAGSDLREAAARFEEALRNGGEWKGISRSLGARLLEGIPAAEHWIIAPDGALATVPFEVLTHPGSKRLVIQDRSVSYLPAARFLLRRSGAPRFPLPPWRTQLVAYGNPPLGGVDSLGKEEQWQPLPGSAREIESIAGELPGRSEIHMGGAAKKHDLLGRHLEGVPLLHFATHAIVDPENPDRSRILMAGDSSGGADYLFQGEIYSLDLKGVDLATISACETARGKIVRGDGVRAFSQAFLAAGASATVTSLWEVADRPTAEFMKQFYYFLSTGQSKSEALRSAKLKFLDSGSAWSEPRYWSAFVLNGDGWDPCPRVIAWSWLVAGAGLVLLAVACLRKLSVPSSRSRLRHEVGAKG